MRDISNQEMVEEITVKLGPWVIDEKQVEGRNRQMTFTPCGFRFHAERVRAEFERLVRLGHSGGDAFVSAVTREANRVLRGECHPRFGERMPLDAEAMGA